jgi:hypothetical protein
MDELKYSNRESHHPSRLRGLQLAGYEVEGDVFHLRSGEGQARASGLVIGASGKEVSYTKNDQAIDVGPSCPVRLAAQCDGAMARVLHRYSQLLPPLSSLMPGLCNIVPVMIIETRYCLTLLPPRRYQRRAAATASHGTRLCFLIHGRVPSTFLPSA